MNGETGGPFEDQFERLLDFIRREREFDFTVYKRSSLTRRVRKRMQELGIEDLAAYQQRLKRDPDEITSLFDTILINVTGFFRDPDAWQYVAEHVIPPVVERTTDEAPIRLWSAGTATGEEAYTLAMLFADAMGVDAFARRVRIYATDVDEAALAAARAGIYSVDDVESVPEEMRGRFFERVGERYHFSPALRTAVIFGRHDLARDAPISRVELLVCRNTLMYFNRQTQLKIIEGLQFALQPEGCIFLGKAEVLLTRTPLFTPMSIKHRVFCKVPARGAAPLLKPPVTERADVTRLTAEPAHASDHLQAKTQALQAANEQLQIANEELETINEELRTATQQLHSSNAELEAANQQLQAANEDLHVTNEQLRSRRDEVMRLSALLGSILSSLEEAIIAVDSQVRVIEWNRHAEQLLGLRRDDAMGKCLFKLEIALPMEWLERPIRRILAGRSGVETLHISATKAWANAPGMVVTFIPLTRPAGVVLLIREAASG